MPPNPFTPAAVAQLILFNALINQVLPPPPPPPNPWGPPPWAQFWRPPWFW